MKLEEIIIPNDSKLETIEICAFCLSTIKRITIPPSVKSIGDYSFSVCKWFEEIIISNDSKLQRIGKSAFYLSKIPSELIELKEKWCSKTSELTKITVSPKNQRYCCYEDKIIIGKTNVNQDNYDCLIFCIRDIEHIQIPNFIEHICSCSFNNCARLEEIIIPSDSKLETIENYAFCSSRIKCITIPSSVTSIEERAFSDCKHLEEIIISNDSKLQTIGNYAFHFSVIKSITIPSSVKSIGRSAYNT